LAVGFGGVAVFDALLLGEGAVRVLELDESQRWDLKVR
jgi:hypothetical protein